LTNQAITGGHTTLASIVLTNRGGDETKTSLSSTTRARIKTPTREGYEIYKAYKIKMQKNAEEERLPIYM
jgi:hypothetical protein